MYNPDSYLVQELGTFLLANNLFSVFCYNLAVIIFLTLLADIQAIDFDKF